MTQWYTKVSGDLSTIPDFIAFYESELASAKYEVSIKGNVEKNVASLPGITEHRFNQLQTIEAVLKFLDLQLRQIRSRHFKKFLEGYNRELSSRDAEKYADGTDEVVDFETLINSVALVRNHYLGLIKGLESKNFMLGHIVRLKVAGMEDMTV